MAQEFVRTYGGAVVSGFGLALLAQLLAVLLIGPGEGWGDPFNFSLALFFIYPVVLVRLKAGRGSEWLALDLGLLVAAVVLDVLLLRLVLGESRRDILHVAAVSYGPHIWAGLWLFWQGLTIWLVARSLLTSSR